MFGDISRRFAFRLKLSPYAGQVEKKADTARSSDPFKTLFQLTLNRIDALSDFRLNGAHALKAGVS